MEDASASSALRERIEFATGAEIGVFEVGSAALPQTCVRSCLRCSDDESVDGACAVVRALINGASHEEDSCPAICDRGHSIAIHRGAASQAQLLLLRPSSGDASNRALGDSRTPLSTAGALWEQCDRLGRENEGLAAELLCSYEQLNVIFDTTKQIGAPQEAAQVKLLLIRKLGEALACGWVCCLSQREGTLWWCAAGQDRQSDTLSRVRHVHADVIQTVAKQRKIVVRNASEAPAAGGEESLVFGPLGAPDEEAEVVVFCRRQDRSAFVSGDMMIIDAVLSHGGHVLFNLQMTERLKTMAFEATRALVSAIDKKDRYTSGHSDRVGFLSRLIGEQMGLTPSNLQDLEWGGLLHDVGKIGIRDDVLNKCGRLTEEEYDHIKQHSKMSFDVLKPLRSFSAVQEMVLYHHETPDGTGYPEGLAGPEIPVLAGIIHVADTFDALTSDRSYRHGFGIEKALEIMRKETGTKLDPEVMASFEGALAAFRAQQPDRFRQMFSHIQEREG